MRKVLLMVLPVLSSVLLAAHFSRVDNDWFAGACLLLPLILFSKKRWAMRVVQLFLVFGTVIWLERTMYLIDIREQNNLPWLRLGIILTVVALFTLASALALNAKRLRETFGKGDLSSVVPVVSAVVVTAGLLSFIHLKVKAPVMLLAERFAPGAGWVEILVLALYAGWITEKILDPAKTARVRTRIWLFFSVVFFAQLILGVLGIEKLLMSGKLHLPVPAMIVAGPLFRGEGFFMLILFTATVLIVGPAWCSYLCYIGAWDNLAAKGKNVPALLPKWRHGFRIGILLLVVVTALLLRAAGVPGIAATLAGAAFGLLGVGIMVWFSRKKGVMVHCVVYCPIGLAANVLGKVSPFRLRITETCTRCGACRLPCRYDALNKEDIESRKPGFTCTLCGDCIVSCNESAINYGFFKVKPGTARRVFIVLVIALHAVFLGVARL